MSGLSHLPNVPLSILILGKRLGSKQGESVVHHHSLVKPGSTYVAIAGIRFNGEDFIPEAIKNGARFIIASEQYKLDIPLDIAICTSDQVDLPQSNKPILILVPNPRLVLSYLASCYYSEQPENIVAITGTNGKTSTSYFFGQIAALCGYKAAIIGTLGLRRYVSRSSLIDKIEEEASYDSNLLTTPDSLQMHSQLDQLAKEKITHVAIEASSHGLDQYRLDFIKLVAAGFTNFSQDHLDYHPNMDHYYKAKKRLFSELRPKNALLNMSIPEYTDLRASCLSSPNPKIESKTQDKSQINIIPYQGLVTQDKPNPVANNSSDNVRVLSYINNVLTIKLFDEVFSVTCKFSINFQIDNLMCAIGLALSTGISAQAIADSIPYLRLPPGRMEKFDLSSGLCTSNDYSSYNPSHLHERTSSFSNRPEPEIYIDYAHTPDSLAIVLRQLKADCLGKLIVVFGCGGNRDTTKRAIMGEIACKYADTIIVTDDNPRHEDPKTIRKEILAGCQAVERRSRVIEIAGRREAIYYAIEVGQTLDRILIAGKGHEGFQIVGDDKISYSDKTCISEYYKRYL